MSVAMTRVLRNAVRGDCKDRVEVAATPIPLTLTLAAVPCRGTDHLIKDLFTPLGYEVETSSDTLAPDSYYRNITLRATKTLSDLLTQVYVLLPVLDSRKHYFIGEAELQKLMEHGKGWLEKHPKRALIVHRYLQNRRVLTSEAFAALEESLTDGRADDPDAETPENPADTERRKNLHEQRLDWVTQTLGKTGASRVVDLGCGEGQLLRRLIPDPQYSEIVGADVSARALELASRRLKIRRLKGAERDRIKITQTSVSYHDPRLNGRVRRDDDSGGDRAHRSRQARPVRGDGIRRARARSRAPDHAQPGVQRQVREPAAQLERQGRGPREPPLHTGRHRGPNGSGRSRERTGEGPGPRPFVRSSRRPG